MKRVFLAGVALSLMAGAAIAAERGSFNDIVQRAAAAQRGDQGASRAGPPDRGPQPASPQAQPQGPGGGGGRGPDSRGASPPSQNLPNRNPQGQGPGGQFGGRGPGQQGQAPAGQQQSQAQAPNGAQRGPGGFQGGQRNGGDNGRGGRDSGPNFPVGPIGNPPVQTPRGGFPTGPLAQPSQPQRGQPQQAGRGQPPQAQGRGPGYQPGRAGPDRGQPDRRIGSAPNNANWDQNRYGRPVFSGGVFQRQRDSGRVWYSPERFRPSYQAPRQFVIRSWTPPIGFYLRSWYSGDFLPYGWYDPPTYLDWAYFGLPFPPIGCEWVRVGRDAVLVDVWSGEVLSVEYNLFFY